MRCIGVATMALAVASCALSKSTAGARLRRTAPGARPGFSTLHVLNQHPEDIRIYLVRSGTWVYVGTAGSLSVRTFALSPAETGAFGSLTLAVETLTSRERYLTELIDLEPGQEIDWQIEGRLMYSRAQARVYRRP